MITSNKIKCLLFTLFFIYFCSFLFGDDRGIGLYYFKQAEILYDSGKITEAEKLLKSSYEFYPDFSETTFLLSLILLKNQHTTLTGLSYLKQALEDNSWVKTDPFIAERELGRVYLRIGLLKEAFQIFQNMGIKLKEDMDSALLLARTLKERDLKEYESFLSDSLKRFPSYSEFYILYAEHLDKTGRKNKAIRILDQGMEKLPDNPDLLLTKIKLTVSLELKEEAAQLLEQYFEKGGQSQMASIIALSLESGDPAHYIDIFFVNGGNRDILFLDQLLLLLKEKEDLLTLFKEKTANYTGERIVDKNRDGFYEELYTYDNGNLILWQRDKNQDGVKEVEISFKENKPVNAGFFTPGESAVYGKYSTYPYLESITFKKTAYTKEFLLLPLDYAYHLFQGGEPEEKQKMQLSVLDRLIPPEEKIINSKAFRVYEYKNGKRISVSEFLNGEYVTLSRDTDGDGHNDHIIDYNNGIPYKGKQDLDGDGYYEIIEYYKDGLLTKITYDHNNDNRPDCLQFYSETGENLETHWDYNSDGVIDAKEMMEKKGKRVFLFSTGYNGKFDLYILFQGGKVVSSRRGNKKLAVIPGTKPGIYWIGKRGKNVNVTLLSGSGLYYIKGVMYFIFRYRDSIYIEELKQ